MDDVHRMPGHLIRRLQQIAVAAFAEETSRAGFDLTPVQYAALAVAAEHPGLDQATLAGLIAYDRSTIGGVVERLAQKGLLAREVSRQDRRARELRVTEAGTALLAEIGPAVEAAQAAMLAGLEDGERATLLALLGKAVAAEEARAARSLARAGGG